MTRDETVTVVVRVNGKVRDRLKVPSDNSGDANVALALSREPMAKILADKPPRKVIYIPQKLVRSSLAKRGHDGSTLAFFVCRASLLRRCLLYA